ncbi:hypothetical protein BGW36DRAFT_424392 [Talaromyces proteolyticus]|uniref:SMP-30/Gluconolactonase/LRE-like region domain-containing protein n=1 Tax=Talaromyces proteolyticus TaxID=1131652 RepID=A0AAD4L1F6_9EURO|nr:uncharacterized protein BGW36DRAFT_424392 [Talaromyces proteolyticus]KAH8702105.1 hypothetical protein BGW36DRAFT_424392 [Talaromyces proteolyticus]
MINFLCILGAATLPLLTLATNKPGYRPYDPEVYTVYQFPENGSWIANIATRPNNDLVITRTDVPEVWAIKVDEGTAELVATIPDANNLIGLSAIDDDVYVVIAGNLDTATLTPEAGSFSAWKVNLDSNNDGSASLIAAIPEGQFLHGVETFQKRKNSTLVLIADAGQGAIYKLDTVSGNYSIAIKNESLAGVNNIHAQNEYLYFTATQNKIFGRVPVDLEEATATGPIEIISDDQKFVPDGFALSTNGSLAYMATFIENSVVAIDLDDEDHPKTTIQGDLNSTSIAGPTAVLYMKKGHDSTLYVTTNGGQTAPVNGEFSEPAKIVGIDL